MKSLDFEDFTDILVKCTAKLTYRMELVEKQVKTLSDKVDRHNNFDRRLVAIETKLDMKQEEKK